MALCCAHILDWCLDPCGSPGVNHAHLIMTKITTIMMRTVIVGIDIDERCNDDDDDDDDAPVKLRIQSLLHGRLHYKSGTNI